MSAIALGIPNGGATPEQVRSSFLKEPFGGLRAIFAFAPSGVREGCGAPKQAGFAPDPMEHAETGGTYSRKPDGLASFNNCCISWMRESVSGEVDRRASRSRAVWQALAAIV